MPVINRTQQQHYDLLPCRCILSVVPITRPLCELLHHFINSPGVEPSMADTGVLWSLWFEGWREEGRKEYITICHTVHKERQPSYDSLFLGAHTVTNLRAFQGNSFTCPCSWYFQPAWKGTKQNESWLRYWALMRCSSVHPEVNFQNGFICAVNTDNEMKL